MAKKYEKESITQYSFHLKGITLGFRPNSMIAPWEYIHDLKILNHLVTVQHNEQYHEECHAALIWLVTI